MKIRINDFDETLPAPWEWDLKRLAVSFVAAARDRQFSNKEYKALGISSLPGKIVKTFI